MTGVGGRPEVIIEGSNNIDGPWMVSMEFAVGVQEPHTYIYTLFMLEIYRVAVELMYSRLYLILFIRLNI